MNTMYDNSFSKNKIQYDQLFLQSKIILQTNAMHGATDDGVKNLSDVYFIHIIAHKICTRIILQNFMRTLYVITEKLLCTPEVHIYSTPEVPNNFP